MKKISVLRLSSLFIAFILLLWFRVSVFAAPLIGGTFWPTDSGEEGTGGNVVDIYGVDPYSINLDVSNARAVMNSDLVFIWSPTGAMKHTAEPGNYYQIDWDALHGCLPDLFLSHDELMELGGLLSSSGFVSCVDDTTWGTRLLHMSDQYSILPYQKKGLGISPGEHASPHALAFNADAGYCRSDATQSAVYDDICLRNFYYAFGYYMVSAFHKAGSPLEYIIPSIETRFSFTTTYAVSYAGAGNGPVVDIFPNVNAISEVITLKCTVAAENGGTFSVIGAISGPLGQAVVGQKFNSDEVSFLIEDRSNDFVVGDTFSFVIERGDNAGQFVTKKSFVDALVAIAEAARAVNPGIKIIYEPYPDDFGSYSNITEALWKYRDNFNNPIRGFDIYAPSYYPNSWHEGTKSATVGKDPAHLEQDIKMAVTNEMVDTNESKWIDFLCNTVYPLNLQASDELPVGIAESTWVSADYSSSGDSAEKIRSQMQSVAYWDYLINNPLSRLDSDHNGIPCHNTPHSKYPNDPSYVFNLDLSKHPMAFVNTMVATDVYFKNEVTNVFTVLIDGGYNESAYQGYAPKLLARYLDSKRVLVTESSESRPLNDMDNDGVLSFVYDGSVSTFLHYTNDLGGLVTTFEYPLQLSTSVNTAGFLGNSDNCPYHANANQMDSDGDGLGDVCDPVKNDFSPDGKADVLLRNLSTGDWNLAQLNGLTVLNQGSLGGAFTSSDNVIVSTADFNGDGTADILTRGTTYGLIPGAFHIHLMSGNNVVDSNWLLTMSQDLNDEVMSTKDFNKDGNADVLLRNSITGVWMINYMIGTKTPPVIATLNAALDICYTLKGDGDYDGNGYPDILLRRDGCGGTTHPWYVYTTDGDATILAGGTLPGVAVSAAWGAEVTDKDFNGDGKADLLLRYLPGTSQQWYLYDINGVGAPSAGGTLVTLQSGWQFSAATDFNGDGKTDILFHSNNTGEWLGYLLNGRTVLSSGVVNMMTSLSWTLQNIDDHNGDGKGDILLRNGGTGQWWLYLMDGITVQTNGTLTINSDVSYVLQND